MKATKKPKRYTLTLPVSVHDELNCIAIEEGVTNRDIVLKCLKLGLLAIRMEKEPEKELVIKEKVDGKTIETKILLF